jgi:hypothetical protein
VVQGKNKNPRSGQTKVEKAASHRTGWASPQTRIATRGPSRTNVVKRQHIAFDLLSRRPACRPVNLLCPARH